MVAYRRVCDSRHLQADCQEPRSAPEAIRSVIEYGLHFAVLYSNQEQEVLNIAEYSSTAVA